MRIDATRQVTDQRPDMTPSDESRQAPVNQDSATGDFGSQAEGGRALAVTAPRSASPEPATNYRPAPFLAHLIATREHAPQTRERRRVSPADANAAYRAAAALTGV